MAGAGDIHAELGLGISQFLDAVNRVEQKLASVKTKTEGMDMAVGKGISGAGVAFAAVIGAGVAAIVAAAAGLKSAFDLGGHLMDLQEQLATSAGNAYLLETALQNAGLAGEDGSKAIGKMQKSLVEASSGGGSAGLFAALKLDPRELMQADPVEAFERMGAAIAQIKNPALRTAASMEIFGKSGAKLMSLFGDGGAMAFAKDQLGRQTEVLDKSVADFDNISDTLGGAGKKLQGFFVGMGSRIIDVIKPLMEEFNKLDLTGIGEGFGQALADGINYFSAAWQALDFVSTANLLSNSLMLGLKEVANFFWSAMWGGVRAFGQYVQEVVRNWVTTFQIVTTADFWKGLGNALLAMGSQFNALMLRGIAAVLHEAAKIPGLGGLSKAEGPLRAMADVEGQAAQGFLKNAGTDLAPTFDALQKRSEEAFRNIWEAYKAGFGKTDQLFSTNEEKAAVEALAAKIAATYASVRKNAKDAAKEAAPGAGGALNFSAKTTTPGVFAQATNFLMGRSINEMQLEEAKSQTAQMLEMNSNLTEIAKNTSNTKPPIIKVDGTARFSH